MAPKAPLIELRAVTKTYRAGRERVAALQAVDMSLAAGELLAIVGPSGSGKTTLTHIIGGLIRPSSGDVLWQGKKLAYGSDRAMSGYRNRSVGFVFQNYSLLPHFTAIENVMMPLVVAGMAPRKRAEIARRSLALLGLADQAGRRSNQLSGGQRQRVGIARALTMQPQLLIADEPTGNLDTQHGNEIMAILTKLSRRHGIAVVLVTHNDQLAAQADRIVRIVDGRIAGSQFTAGPAVNRVGNAS